MRLTNIGFCVVCSVLAASCAADKYPALTACKKLEKAGVATGCVAANAPTGVSYALDTANFWTKPDHGNSQILMFKDDADYNSARELYTGVETRHWGLKVQTFPNKRMLVLLDKDATSDEIDKTRGAF